MLGGSQPVASVTGGDGRAIPQREPGRPEARVRKGYVELGSGRQGRLGTLEEHERRITAVHRLRVPDPFHLRVGVVDGASPCLGTPTGSDASAWLPCSMDSRYWT